MNTINRNQYFNDLLELKNTTDIKTITGVKGVGKSQLMLSFIKYLKENEDNINIVYIDFNDIDNEKLMEYHKLHDFIMNKYDENKTNYLFIDEIQMCQNFEVAINSIHNKNIYDIYLTGSNAFLMSSDLATLFTGRFMEVHVYPFSFKEYFDYYENKDKNSLFNDYVLDGGLSGSYLYKDRKDKNKYIKDVYETIIKRDLVDRYNLGNRFVFDNISNFLMDNISNLTTPNKISGVLVNDGINTNHVTVSNYLKYLCDAFLFYEVKRYDISGKKYLLTNSKYYLSDTSFRYSLLGTKNMNYGRSYENIVAIELLRRGYDIYVGKLYSSEIDFVAVKNDEQIYIQVSSDISSETTFKREVEPLLKIRDAYPKMVIARTHEPEYSYEGVKIIDIVDWLLK